PPRRRARSRPPPSRRRRRCATRAESPPASPRRPPGSPAELLGEQAERVQPPGELDVARQEQRRLPQPRQLAHAQDDPVEPVAEGGPPLVGEEVGCERLDRTIV